MKLQKNILISFVSLLIQFAIIWIPVLLNLAMPQKVTGILFWIFGGVSFIFAAIALIRREAASGFGIILVESLLFYWFVAMGR